MKIKYGYYEDEFYAPLAFIGIMKDIRHDGSTIYALVFVRWYIGIIV